MAGNAESVGQQIIAYGVLWFCCFLLDESGDIA